MAIVVLKTIVRYDYIYEQLIWASDSRLIIHTAHYRENFGESIMHHTFRVIHRLVDEMPDIKVIYPIHMSLVVVKAAKEII